METVISQALSAGERAGARYCLVPPRSLPRGHNGNQLGRRVGSSLEFMDYRDYQPGDDLRALDWNAYARSDRLIVKLFREEVTPHLDLVLDGSLSMNLPSTSKAESTTGLAALLATAARNAQFSHNTWLTRAGCDPVENGNMSPTTWRGVDYLSTFSPTEAFTARPPRWHQGGVRVLLSDLMFLGDPETLVGLLAEGCARLLIVQILAEVDIEPPEFGNVRLHDVETNTIREVFVDAALAARYRATLARHQDSWHRATRRVGARMVTCVAEKLWPHWDLDDLLSADFLQVL